MKATSQQLPSVASWRKTIDRKYSGMTKERFFFKMIDDQYWHGQVIICSSNKMMKTAKTKENE
jgi:hypothetical protein